MKYIKEAAFSPEAYRIRKEVRDVRRKITAIVLPHTIQFIGEYAFAWCESLQSIVIPDSVERLGFQMFYRCSDLASVTLPTRLKSLSAEIFARCEVLENTVLQ